MIPTFLVPFEHLDTVEVGWLRAHLGFAVISACKDLVLFGEVVLAFMIL